jgi:hypothetical protein
MIHPQQAIVHAGCFDNPGVTSGELRNSPVEVVTKDFGQE